MSFSLCSCFFGLILQDPLGDEAVEELDDCLLYTSSCSSTQPVSMLNLQALSSYFMFVFLLPYGTFTVVTFVIRLF